MNITTIRQIEEAAMNAWPARHQQLFDGWLLRFTDGYTKRANSVMPVYESSLNVDDKIDYCEEYYRHMGLPPIFRLTPLAQGKLDLALEERGYPKIDPTRVMTLELTDWQSPTPVGASWRELPLEQWMGVYSEISGSLIERQPAHVQILRNILNPHSMAALEISGKWVACGLGVLERGWFGLFDIITHPDCRQQGLGTQLVTELLGWAKSQGAASSYLQVMESNDPALGMYAKMGYAKAYGYWYRVPPTWE
jgi:hypothetical protein